MGYLYRHQQEQASKYIFECLKNKDYLDFNFFYDGTEETEQKNIEVFSGEYDDATAIIDFTIIELANMRIIEIEELEEKLADGENNFRIWLTEKGKRVLNNEIKLEFRDLDL
jgi:hypothetical protein